MIAKFFKDSVLYSSSRFISMVVSFFLLPIFTRYMSPDEYGVVEMITIVYALLNLILTLEVSQGLARFLPDAGDCGGKSGYASTAFWFAFGMFAVFFIFCYLWPAVLGRAVMGGQESRGFVAIVSGCVCAHAMVYQIQNLLKWSLKPGAWMAITMAYVLVGNLTSVALVAGWRKGITGYVVGQTIGFGLALMIGLWLARKGASVRWQFDWKKLREMIGFASPLVLSSSACYISQYMDRWMLKTMLSLEDVGIYGASFRIASIVTLAIVGAQQALGPLVYHSYKNTDTPFLLASILRYFAVVVFVLVGLVSAFARELVGLLVDSDFHGAASIVGWQAFAIVLHNVYIFAPGMRLAKKTKRIALANVVAAITNCLLNFLLIPVWGRTGAVAATVGGGVIMNGLYFWWSYQEYPIPYPWKRLLPAISLLVGILLAFGSVEMSWISRLGLWVLASLATVPMLFTWEDGRLLWAKAKSEIHFVRKPQK